MIKNVYDIDLKIIPNVVVSDTSQTIPQYLKSKSVPIIWGVKTKVNENSKLLILTDEWKNPAKYATAEIEELVYVVKCTMGDTFYYRLFSKADSQLKKTITFVSHISLLFGTHEDIWQYLKTFLKYADEHNYFKGYELFSNKEEAQSYAEEWNSTKGIEYGNSCIQKIKDAHIAKINEMEKQIEYLTNQIKLLKKTIE